MTLDAIVVGGGPAGLSAATWLGQYRRTVLVLDSGEYRNRWADASHGYLSRDPANPAELLARARDDLDAYPTAEVRHARAVKAAPDDDCGFEVVTEGERLTGRRLVLATGVRDELPDIEGFFDHYGASVFHCPWCDGYEAKGRPVAANGATTAPGVFAAGDVTPGLQLVQVAAGSGAIAGVGCALSLENDPTTPPPLPLDVDDQIQVTSTGRS